jgi:threonine 3-dehydrogenase
MEYLPMKAIVKSKPAPGLDVMIAKDPTPGERDVIVKVRMAGICGTDLHIYSWDEWSKNRIRPPVILGHELVGDVVEVGPEVTRVKKGEYVSAECHITCGKCYQCKTGEAHICQDVKVLGVDMNGCFAEYIAVPESQIWKVDQSIAPEIAAILDPIGNAVYTVLSGEVAGLTLGVVGCGPIGLVAAAVARASGATRVYAFDISDYRLNLAEQVGADEVINDSKVDPIEAVMEETDGAGLDVVLEMSGNPNGIRTAFKVLRRGGRMSMLGLPKEPLMLDIANDIVLKGITIHGIHGRKIFRTWYEGTRMLKSGRINLDPIITHKMAFEDIDKAMEVMKEGLCGKVLLFPNGTGLG